MHSTSQSRTGTVLAVTAKSRGRTSLSASTDLSVFSAVSSFTTCCSPLRIGRKFFRRSGQTKPDGKWLPNLLASAEVSKIVKVLGIVIYEAALTVSLIGMEAVTRVFVVDEEHSLLILVRERKFFYRSAIDDFLRDALSDRPA